MKRLKGYTAAGIVFVSVIGTLAHFVYEWSGQNSVAGLFFPVNESTWEHMKLLFFPALLYFLIMTRGLKGEYPAVGAAAGLGILVGCGLIPVIFYTYTGVLGYHTLFLDIVTFLAAVAAAFYVTYKKASCDRLLKYGPALKTAVCALMLLFFVFTYFPPGLGLFQSP